MINFKHLGHMRKFAAILYLNQPAKLQRQAEVFSKNRYHKSDKQEHMFWVHILSRFF